MLSDWFYLIRFRRSFARILFDEKEKKQEKSGDQRLETRSESTICSIRRQKLAMNKFHDARTHAVHAVHAVQTYNIRYWKMFRTRSFRVSFEYSLLSHWSILCDLIRKLLQFENFFPENTI